MPTPNFAGHSDIGRKRTRNDDRWGADPALGLYMVADGVGSSTHGDLAAALTVEGLPAYVAHYLGGADLDDGQAAARLGGAVGQLSEDLYVRSRTDESIAGADTTLVAAVITDSRVLVAHLGDSRAYLYRDGRMQRLTRDHTIVQAVVDAGEITEEEAAHHPNRSVLTRHVLMKPPSKPDASAVDLQPGDRILLCSDGLHGLIDDTTLAAILTRHPDPADACQVLIEAANQAGGSDNITAVVVNVGEVAPAPAPGPAQLDDTVALSQAPTVPYQVASPNIAATQQRSPALPPPPPAPPAGVPPPQIGTPPPQRRRRRGAVMWGVIAGIVVVVAAVVAGYLLWPPGPSAPQAPTTPTSPTTQPVPTTRHTLQPAAPAGPTVLPFDPERGLGFVAVDRSGNVYVTDYKPDPATGVGKDEHVLRLGPGSSTPTVLPFTASGHLSGLAVDAAGNVYVTDSFSVTSDVDNHVVKLAAGSGSPSVLPFTGLADPAGVAVDGGGNVYVVDLAGNRVVKLAAGSGTQTVLPFNGLRTPEGVALDGDGNVYVTDMANSRVVKLAAGSSSQSVLPFTGLRSPWGVAVDNAGNLYVADIDSHQIVKLAAGSGAQSVVTVSGMNGLVSNAIAVDTAGNLYIVDDAGSRRVVKAPMG